MYFAMTIRMQQLQVIQIVVPAPMTLDHMMNVPPCFWRYELVATRTTSLLPFSQCKGFAHSHL